MPYSFNLCNANVLALEPDNCRSPSNLDTTQKQEGEFTPSIVSIHPDPNELAGEATKFRELSLQETSKNPSVPKSSLCHEARHQSSSAASWVPIYTAGLPKILQPVPIHFLDTHNITSTYYPAILERPEHDFYPERFALSPDETMPLHAGPHYSDFYALDEDDRTSSRSLEPLGKAGRAPSFNTAKLPTRGRNEKKRAANELETDLEGTTKLYPKRAYTDLRQSRTAKTRKHLEKHGRNVAASGALIVVSDDSNPSQLNSNSGDNRPDCIVTGVSPSVEAEIRLGAAPSPSGVLLRRSARLARLIPVFAQKR